MSGCMKELRDFFFLLFFHSFFNMALGMQHSLSGANQLQIIARNRAAFLTDDTSNSGL